MVHLWHHQDVKISGENKSEAKWWPCNKCSLCTEWCSTTIVGDDSVLVRTDFKEMYLCPIRAFFEALLFLIIKPALLRICYFKRIVLIEQCTRDWFIVYAEFRTKNSSQICLLLVFYWSHMGMMSSYHGYHCFHIIICKKILPITPPPSSVGLVNVILSPV